MFRRHRAPIQCVRCWLFFKDQFGLDTHLSVDTICKRRPGTRTDGITPDMEKRLRSRKKTFANQTEEERWREIYGMLFPDEDVPTACKFRFPFRCWILPQPFPQRLRLIV
jgi:hypothetical protein